MKQERKHANAYAQMQSSKLVTNKSYQKLKHEYYLWKQEQNAEIKIGYQLVLLLSPTYVWKKTFQTL